MSPRVRRALYAVTFETGGLLLSTVSLFVVTDSGAAHALGFSVLSSTLALFWSYAFNTLFESWECRQITRGRSPARRAAHALLFELTLILLLLPLTMWWFNLDLLTGLAIETSLSLAFIAYTYLFTWAFDRIFGLPQASR